MIDLQKGKNFKRTLNADDYKQMDDRLMSHGSLQTSESMAEESVNSDIWWNEVERAMKQRENAKKNAKVDFFKGFNESLRDQSYKISGQKPKSKPRSKHEDHCVDRCINDFLRMQTLNPENNPPLLKKKDTASE